LPVEGHGFLKVSFFHRQVAKEGQGRQEKLKILALLANLGALGGKIFDFKKALPAGYGLFT
jgi:hypothetical protein